MKILAGYLSAPPQSANSTAIRATPWVLLSMIGASVASFAIGLWQKWPCHAAGWPYQRELIFGKACYSDFPVMYTARGLAEGHFPYATDRSFEYPVLTGYLADITARLVTTPAAYYLLNSALMLLCTIVTAWATVRLTGRVAAGLIVALSPALIATATINWDMLPVMLTALALLAWARERPELAGLAIGLGAAAKLYPALLLFAFLLARRDSLSTRPSHKSLPPRLSPKSLPPRPSPKSLPPRPSPKSLPPRPSPKSLPPRPSPKSLPPRPSPKSLPPRPSPKSLPRRLSQAQDRATCQAKAQSGLPFGAIARQLLAGGPFGRALAAAVATWLVVNLPVMLLFPQGWLEFFRLNQSRPADFGSAYYALQLLGFGPIPSLNTVAMLLFGTCLIAIALWAPRHAPVAAFLTIAAFLVTNKVYSPQYVLWLIPLAVIAGAPMLYLMLWQMAEIAYWSAVWHHLLGTISPDGYATFTFLRIAAVLVLAVSILATRRSYSPSLDRLYHGD